MSTHTKIYGLLTTPILHTILIPRKKEKEKKPNNQKNPTRLITTQSKCFATKDISSEITSRKRKEKEKKKENEQRKKKRTRKLLITPSQHYW